MLEGSAGLQARVTVAPSYSHSGIALGKNPKAANQFESLPPCQYNASVRTAPFCDFALLGSKENLLDGTTVYVLIVVFAATLIRSVFGFGEALIAVPLLALRIPVHVAAPLAVLVSITVAAVIVAQDWRKINLRSTGWLVPPTLFGIPLGLLLLTSGNHRLVKAALAVVIMAFSGYALIGRKPPELHSDSRL